ncbi:PqqD family peptide modification chaperone [Asticcacaulis sp. DW145]|uniref:PqqD family protein n=1 Tax=Asticcacaulis sp. DW145 TaxID=3095608 RepID=UPI003086612F|nr:PqqD family peptide modification chaperone [Asticcacaulis sp. DW145]
MSLTELTKVQLVGNTAVSNIEDGLALIDLDKGNYYYLNTTASLVWQGLQSGSSIKDIVERIVTDFDVEVALASSDVLAIVEELLKEGFAKVC